MNLNSDRVLKELENLGTPSASSNAHHILGDVFDKKICQQSCSFSDTTFKNINKVGNPDNSEHSFIEVKSSPDKGSGLFALRKIPAGTLLFAEHPLISLEKHEEDDPEAVERGFNKLTRTQQKQYLKLFDAEKSDMTKVVSIYYSNCYNTDGFKDQNEGGSCIGVLASRINHSCIPNAQFSYNSENDLMTFHAIKAIPRGKEVLSNYEKNVFETAHRRKQKQRLHYGFVCTCEACEPQTAFWAKSDDRRRAMAETRSKIRECEISYEQTGSTQQDPIGLLKHLESLLIKEGLCSTLLANTYRSMSKWARRNQANDEEMKWKRKERDLCIICFGSESGRVTNIEQELRQAQNENDK